MVKQTLEQTYKLLLDQYYLPTLKKYVTIKNTSRLFKQDISQRDAVAFVVDWLHSLELQSTMILEFKENNMPPALLVITEPITPQKTVMVYGFLDKQPEMTCQWTDNKSAYEPVLDGNKLYGRGTSEGIGSLIASALMIKAFQIEKTKHDRIVLFFETDKNSGSCDAYYFYQKHKDLIGNPDILYCLDGSVPNYDNMYFTNSLKGSTVFDLKVSVGKTGVHSGLGGGLLPDSYRVLSDLLNRIECPSTGILCDEFYCEIPDKYKQCMKEFYDQIHLDYQIKYKKNVQPPQTSFDLFIQNIWEPQLINLARDNLPEVAEAGNVLRAYTIFRMKLQTSPLCKADNVKDTLQYKLLGEKALNNAKVDLDILYCEGGMYQDNMCPEVKKVLDVQTQKTFQKNPGYWGSGDFIPFLGQMKQKNEKLQVILTGVKSFDSKSKSGNENVNVEYAGKVYQTMFDIVNNCNSVKKQQQKKINNKQQQINKEDNQMEFEDEWEDDYEEEIIEKPRDNDDQDFEEEDNVDVFLGTKKDLQQNQQLQMSNEAYKMFHSAATEWPCLSFDVLINNNGNFQMQNFNNPINFQYPIEVFMVGGSQSEYKDQNYVYLMHFTDLSITQYDDDEDVEDSFEETDPQMTYIKIPLSSNTNRIKSMNNQNIIAIMNDSAQLQILNLQHNFEELTKLSHNPKPFSIGKPNIVSQFLLTQEGFGLNFSPLAPGVLACGSSDGNITLFQSADQNFSGFVQNSQKIQFNESSIEDIQFSPKEEHVLAVCGCDGMLRIMDLRTPFNNIQHMYIQAHQSDVNVISWNRISQNLLASGGDDSYFKIWDLRYIGKEAISEINWHQGPITALEWQPHDEWTIAVSSSDDRLSIWDLSVENDDQIQNQEIPEQLLFLHQGQEDLKDLKWHPQYKDVIMSTALDGYNIFHPYIEDEKPQPTEDLVLNQLTS